MDSSKRSLLSAFTAMLLTPLVGRAEDSVIAPTSSEAKMIAYMKERGVNHFVMFSKQRGQLLYIVNSKITDSDAALSGKIKGNTARDELGVTPAGIFKMENIGDSDSIGFKKVPYLVDGVSLTYTMHPVSDVPGQRRQERLESMRPEWQRISSGCINVAKETIARIRGFMTMKQIFHDENSDRKASGSFLVVLPEEKPVESIFKFPELQPE